MENGQQKNSTDYQTRQEECDGSPPTNAGNFVSKISHGVTPSGSCSRASHSAAARLRPLGFDH
jgi:hypothetical protein